MVASRRSKVAPPPPASPRAADRSSGAGVGGGRPARDGPRAAAALALARARGRGTPLEQERAARASDTTSVRRCAALGLRAPMAAAPAAASRTHILRALRPLSGDLDGQGREPGVGEVVPASLAGAGPRKTHLGERVGWSCSGCGRRWRWVLQDDCELRATGLQVAEGEGSKG
jgi:hypothetical protein